MNPDTKTLEALRIDRARPTRSRWPAVVAILLLLILAAAGGVMWWLKRPQARTVRTIVVQQTVSGREKTLLNASGYVTARREATVSSKVTGKVVEVLVEEGMRVEAGQILAKLDAANVERSLHLAEAQLELARKQIGETAASLVQAEREYTRLKALIAQTAASQVELDRAETEVKALRARLERQQADISVSEFQVALWQQQIDDTIIRAPFAGIVTSKNAQPGEMISPTSAGGGFTRTGICTIVDISSLEIEVDVSESYINRVQSGQPVEATLDSYPNWRIPAKVIAIIPTADRQKATVKVRVGFEKLDPRILPDMSVKVAFQAAGEVATTQRSLTLPKEAVQQRDGRDVVWIVRDGRVERRAVTVGETQGAEVAIAAGVGVGERVVVQGGDQLADGDQVVEATR